MKGVEEPIYWAGVGDYTWKIIEMADKVSKRGDQYISMLLKNSHNEYYQEGLYPDQHMKRIYQIALALGIKADENNDLDTHSFIGGFIKARIDYIIFDSGVKRGMKSERLYLMNIRPSNRRKDTTGSTDFNRVKKPKYGIGVKNERPNAQQKRGT